MAVLEHVKRVPAAHGSGRTFVHQLAGVQSNGFAVDVY